VLAEKVAKRLAARGVATSGGPDMVAVMALYKERVSTLNELADAVEFFYKQMQPVPELLEKHLTPDVVPALKALAAQLSNGAWAQQVIHDAIQQAVTDNGLKFPKIAMPLRVMVTGGAQSPSIDAVMELMGKQEVLTRIGTHLD
jgi:glutamyl-tRNA synthetase